jgi:hypothetical protein
MSLLRSSDYILASKCFQTRSWPGNLLVMVKMKDELMWGLIYSLNFRATLRAMNNISLIPSRSLNLIHEASCISNFRALNCEYGRHMYRSGCPPTASRLHKSHPTLSRDSHVQAATEKEDIIKGLEVIYAVWFAQPGFSTHRVEWVSYWSYAGKGLRLISFVFHFRWNSSQRSDLESKCAAILIQPGHELRTWCSNKIK